MACRRKNVVVLTSTFPRWQGDAIPRFVLDLCRQIAEHFDVVVIAPHYPGASGEENLEGVQVRRFRYAPVKLQVLSGAGGIMAGLKRNPVRAVLLPFFLVGMLWSTVRVLRSRRVDVIHAHWIIPQGVIAIWSRWLSGSKAKVLCTSHGGDLYSISGLIGNSLRRLVVQNVDTLTVVSTAMWSTVRTMFPTVETPLKVAPMGADLVNTFIPEESVRATDTILFVGRLAEKKGLDVLLRAFKLVLESHPTAKLRVVGTGPEYSDLLQLASSLSLKDEVIWIGALTHDEIVKEYRAAGCLVFPSVVAKDGDQEGLGLVPVEALGCECPVIASDLPAVRDVVCDGETGLLVLPGSPGALAEAIARILDDPTYAACLAKRGREYVLAHFDWEEVGNRYVKIIESLCMQ